MDKHISDRIHDKLCLSNVVGHCFWEYKQTNHVNLRIIGVHSQKIISVTVKWTKMHLSSLLLYQKRLHI